MEELTQNDIDHFLGLHHNARRPGSIPTVYQATQLGLGSDQEHVLSEDKLFEHFFHCDLRTWNFRVPPHLTADTALQSVHNSGSTAKFVCGKPSNSLLLASDGMTVRQVESVVLRRRHRYMLQSPEKIRNRIALYNEEVQDAKKGEMQNFNEKAACQKDYNLYHQSHNTYSLVGNDEKLTKVVRYVQISPLYPSALIDFLELDFLYALPVRYAGNMLE
ncbi:uncharacterized protein LY79DRAFT_580502 [Colletotrichum navitas]|uniref:Uncharacterized protein n=1 Tax=Colletotrichum navitas TaxID=681940 RepID=A0AAD8PX06_9PEZI|nr:uncharacterized protein LY79DRAFT_580502 [Colletotrichum navitas]KAK1589664.1 hypothetical protein LY79DRAFT_580502 [Colletotrichum navitas]